MEWVQNHSMKVPACYLGLWNSECSTQTQQNEKKIDASTGLLVKPRLYARLLNMLLKKDLKKLFKKKRKKERWQSIPNSVVN